jgi:hypothetical protein
MKHIGWKIAFGISWIPASWLYANTITCFMAMDNPDMVESLAGGIGFFALLIPSILFALLQAFLGWRAFK